MENINENQIEKEIISLFVRKNKRKRIRWELARKEKRENVLWMRFNHEHNLMDDCMIEVDQLSYGQIKKILFEMSKAKDVYYMGEDEIRCMDLNEAINRASEGEICLIYCGNGIGYYRGEEHDDSYLLIALDVKEKFKTKLLEFQKKYTF